MSLYSLNNHVIKISERQHTPGQINHIPNGFPNFHLIDSWTSHIACDSHNRPNNRDEDGISCLEPYVIILHAPGKKPIQIKGSDVFSVSEDLYVPQAAVLTGPSGSIEGGDHG